MGSKQAVFKYLHNTSWIFFEKLFRLLIGLFVGIYVARYLGPENFGILNYSVSFIALTTVFSSIAYRGVIVREVITDKINYDKILFAAFMLNSAGLMFSILLTLSVNFFVNSGGAAYSVVLFILISIVFQPFMVISYFFQANHRLKYVAISSVVGVTIAGMYRIYLIYMEADLEMFAITYVIEGFFTTLLLIYIYINKKYSTHVNVNVNVNFKYLKKIFNDSYPLVISGVFVTIFLKIDQVMIKELSNFTEVGNYVAAVKISNVWTIFPVALSASLFPIVIRAYKKSTTFFYTRLASIYYVFIMLGLFATFFTYFYSSELILLLFGNEYVDAIPILRIHSLSIVLIFLMFITANYLVLKNEKKLILKTDIVTAISNVILNMFLIPKYGAYGASIATLISYALKLFLVFSYKRNKKLLLIMTSPRLLKVIKWKMMIRTNS